MQKFVLATIAAVTVAVAPALAADMAVKAARPMPAPIYNWTGCYLDGGGGYGLWTQDHFSETDPGHVALSATTTSGGRGWYGQVGGGCDYQFTLGTLGNFIIGALGDYSFMNLHGTFADPAAPAQGNEKERSSWAAGARFGYLVTPDILVYWSGGYTQARFNRVDGLTVFLPVVPTGNSMSAHTYNGWFLGGGTEMSLSRWLPVGWFLRSDYRYSTFRAADVPVVFTATGLPTGIAENNKKYVQMLGTELVYRFNFTGR